MVLLQANEIIEHIDKQDVKSIYLMAKMACDKCDNKKTDNCYACQGTGVVEGIVPCHEFVSLINNMIAERQKLLLDKWHDEKKEELK